MLNLKDIKKICIVGAGTAGWFAALQMRHIFKDSIEIEVIATSEIPTVGVGEGGILNLMSTLQRFDIPFLEFMIETDAVHKLGFAYEGWRTGDKNDVYYHMFPYLVKHQISNGYYPNLSILANHNIPISYVVDSIMLRENNISQSKMTEIFINSNNQNFLSSFHFDTYKVAKYLKRKALERNVRYIESKIDHVFLNNETGHIEALGVSDTKIECDFVVDASGFSRLLIGKQFEQDWVSLSDRLVMNTAIPFHLKHPKENPDLVTRSIAMNSGWMWQIPLQERVGAGYVFNDSFVRPEKAVDEVERLLGQPIEPIKIIKFDAGYYKNIWVKNVLAVGLSSGFVEPLEATSIGQMLMQLELFETLVLETQGIVMDKQIQFYNDQNRNAWESIGDFIRMHYDTPRQDTDFWKSTYTLPQSDLYKSLKEIWKYRTPRSYDLIPYQMDTMSHFGIYSWFTIGQALGIIKPEVTVNELLALTSQQRQSLSVYMNETYKRLGVQPVNHSS